MAKYVDVPDQVWGAAVSAIVDHDLAAAHVCYEPCDSKTVSGLEVYVVGRPQHRPHWLSIEELTCPRLNAAPVAVIVLKKNGVLQAWVKDFINPRERHAFNNDSAAGVGLIGPHFGVDAVADRVNLLVVPYRVCRAYGSTCHNSECYHPNAQNALSHLCHSSLRTTKVPVFYRFDESARSGIRVSVSVLTKTWCY